MNLDEKSFFIGWAVGTCQSHGRPDLVTQILNAYPEVRDFIQRNREAPLELIKEAL